MRFVKSKLLQKAEGRKRGKYLVTLEVTDHDIDCMEDLAVAHCSNFMNSDKFHRYIGTEGIFIDAKVEEEDFELQPKYNRFLHKAFWKCFHKLWRQYD